MIFGTDPVPVHPAGPIAYDTSQYAFPVLNTDRLENDARASLAGMDWDDITHVDGVPYQHFEHGALPDGKTWVRLKPDAAYERYFTRQPIDVFDPRVLRMLLRVTTGKAVSGGYAIVTAPPADQVIEW